MPIEFTLSLQTQNSFDIIKRSINCLNCANMELLTHGKLEELLAKLL